MEDSETQCEEKLKILTLDHVAANQPELELTYVSEEPVVGGQFAEDLDNLDAVELEDDVDLEENPDLDAYLRHVGVTDAINDAEDYKDNQDEDRDDDEEDEEEEEVEASDAAREGTVMQTVDAADEVPSPQPKLRAPGVVDPLTPR